VAKILNKIIINSREIRVIKYRRYFLRTWCSKCNREVGMISPFDAALLLGKDLQTIDDLMKANQFHLSHLSEDANFICINSLSLH
jgi:hypothetical protein